jgi:hypothetical protein
VLCFLQELVKIIPSQKSTVFARQVNFSTLGVVPTSCSVADIQVALRNAKSGAVSPIQREWVRFLAVDRLQTCVIFLSFSVSQRPHRLGKSNANVTVQNY